MTIQEAAVSDRKYINLLEGLSLLKYEADKDRLVYYGKNNMPYYGEKYCLVHPLWSSKRVNKLTATLHGIYKPLSVFDVSKMNS